MTRLLTLSLLALAVLLVSSVLAFELFYADRVFPGIQLWDAEVGGARIGAAASALDGSLGLDAPLVTLRGPDRSWRASPIDLGLEVDPKATLTRVYRLGRGHSLAANLLSHLQLLAFGAEFPPVLVYDESVSRRYLQDLAERIYVPPIDASLTFSGTVPVAEPAQPGRRLEVEATLAALAPAVTRLTPEEVELVVSQIQPTVTDAGQAKAEAEALLDGPLTLVLAHPRDDDPGPWVISPDQLVEMLEVRAEGGVLHTVLDEEPLRAYLQGLSPALAIEPVDARFHFNERTAQLEPISPSREGRELDVEASLATIVDALVAGQRYVPLVVQAVPPRYPDSATAEELDIIDLVGEGESYFIGSPSGRDHNIRLAASQFDGLVIPPGEIFSFNHHLGEVTAEAGYDESYITAGEQLQMGIGGGICQVSTTAFRAAFWGGYPITERWYHYQRVGYYELLGGEVGMDATVYSPHVDLKFTNDRSAPLLIETEVEERAHRLVFRFYSTDDGRRVEKEGPVVSDETEPGPPIYQLDEELEPGTVIKWQSAVGGLTATVERRVYDAAGEVLHHDVFVSEYAPRRAAYHYGPGYEPPSKQEKEP